MTQLTMLPENVFTDPWKLREFILAGNAKITLRSEKTLKHYTYKIRKAKDGDIWFVSRLSSDSKYIYLGSITKHDEHFVFDRTRNSVTHRWLAESFDAFKWFWKVLREDRLPATATVWHEGRCGMCGKELTDPVSIKNGYGPDCSKMRLSRPFMYDRNAA